MTDELDEIKQAIKKDLDTSDFMKKSDFNELFQANADVTLKSVIDHGNCGQEGCSICGMKNKIHEGAYKKGLTSGISLGRKYPKHNFGVI